MFPVPDTEEYYPTLSSTLFKALDSETVNLESAKIQ